jgi:hypothetical protein
MNVIVSFKSRNDRDAVLAQLRADWPELVGKSFIPRTRNDAIFEGLSDEDYGRLHVLVGARGRVFHDVKFEPFERR